MPTFAVRLGIETGPGTFAFTVSGTNLAGQSRQPLLDACRLIQRTHGPVSGDCAALYRHDQPEPAAVCSVAWGASHYVDEDGAWFRTRPKAENQV